MPTFEGFCKTFNPFLNASVDVALGVEIGHTLSVSQANESSYRAGHHYLATGISQSIQASYVACHTIRAASAAMRPLSAQLSQTHEIIGTVSACVLPLGVALLAKVKFSNPLLRKTIYFIHRNIGNLCQVVSAISSVALVFFGQPFIGASALICFGVSVISRQSFVSDKFRNTIHVSGFILANATRLILGSPITKLYAIADIVTSIALRYLSGDVEMISQVVHEDAGAVKTTMKLVNDPPPKNHIQLNKGHLHYNILPPPDVNSDIQGLLDIADEIDWTEHMAVISEKLKVNERWKQIGTGKGTEIEYFKNSLQEFVASIKEHKIKDGQPWSYEMLVTYCQHIYSMLLKSDNEISKADVLLSLGLDGGHICGPGKYRIAEHKYFELSAQNPEQSLKTRVLNTLMLQRERIFQTLYCSFWTSTPFNQLLGHFFDTCDTHTYNQIISVMGREFGLPSQSAKNDKTVVLSAIDQVILSLLYSPLTSCFWGGGNIEQVFFQNYSLKKNLVKVKGYTVQSIIDCLNNTIRRNSEIKDFEVATWWDRWAMKQKGMNEAQRFALSNQIQADLFEEYHDFSKGRIQKRIKYKYMVTMLFEMGIITGLA